MTETTTTAGRRWPWLLALVATVVVVVWKHEAGRDAPALVTSARTDSRTPVAAFISPQPHAREQLEDMKPVAVAIPLPQDHLATLIEAGISADDSEQRSLATLELTQAPVEQSLPGLDRILRENRDWRSRMTALAALMRLPESPLVREWRQQLLELLSRDPDARVAEAAGAIIRAASSGAREFP